tara:strand:+ start:2737 stop:8517 length:5781 start_codon:yes stop_codon:yes gene_type:complete
MSKKSQDSQISQELIEKEIDLDTPQLPEKINIKLQLGDIIQLDSPSNYDLNDKIFFIKFINTKKLVLLNEEKEITLDISDEGKLLEESINNILLLSRHDSPSFIIQNNLTINKYISIYVGEPVPKVINGTITNIEEDMIEITTIPDKELMYIDFEYSGIPEELNIEKIIVRETIDKFIIESLDSEKSKLTDEDLEEKEKYLDLENAEELDYDLKNYSDQDNLDELLVDSIEIGPELEELYHSVNVPEDEQRFSLDKQLNDYLDKSINNYLPEERNVQVMNNINFEINRYKELRNIYSEFDKNLNPNIPQEKGEFYKPLKEVLFNLNKKLYWILPVISNSRNIISELDDEEEFLDEEFINKQKMGEFIEELNNIINHWSNNSSKEKVNNYKNYIENIFNILDNYHDKSIEKMDVNDQINIVNDLYDDFYSYVVKDKSIKKSRFVMDVYNEGLKMLESYYFDNKKLYKFKELTNNDRVNIISFITLPLPIFNFSKINLEYTNIHDRSVLNSNFLLYSKLFNNNTTINKYITDEKLIPQFINSHENIHDNTIFNNINNFMIDDTIEIDYKEKYNLLLESFIPTKKNIINNYTNLHEKPYCNLLEILYELQPFNIDLYKLHISDYKLLRSNIENNIIKYKTNYKKQKDLLTKLVLMLNRNIKDTQYKFSFDLLNKDLKEQLFANYKLNEEDFINNDELYSYFIKIDSAKFFMNSLNKNIMDLIVSNLLDSFIKTNKDADKEEMKDKFDEEKCEKYILSKKYNTLQEVENDNSKLIFFDSIYDNTFYSIINEYKTEKDNMDSKHFFEFLAQKLKDNMNLTHENALREAQAIIEEKREVLNGDYSLLIDKETKKNYIFTRRDNIWIIDEQFKENFYIDSNKILCNTTSDCVSLNDKCMSKDDALKQNLKKDVGNILDNFKMHYNLSVEEIKGKINDIYAHSINYLHKLLIINGKNKEKHNDILLEFDHTYDTNIITSPHENIRDKILGQKDFAAKQDSIKKFCILYTREAINDENNYWLYCNKTGVKLIPLFLLKLANAFINKEDYIRQLDYICADQGTISDDNNYWVDKHSGYIIKRIDFNTEEGFDEQGYKLTRNILDNEYTINSETNEKSLNPTIKIVINILKAMSQMAGINISNYHEFIINNVITIQNSSIPNKKQYEQFLLKTAKKDGKVKESPSYEDTFNSSLLILTFSFIILTLQISIPSIKSKKTFPGCIKSFSGYPLEGDQDKSTIIYMSCIANKIKSSIKPWNSILKMSESTIVKKIEAIMDKYVLKNKDAIKLIEKKREYLLYNKVEEIPESLSLNSWTTFNPPLVDFKINKEILLPLSDTFKDKLLDSFSKGKKNDIYETLQSKIIYFSGAIIESIQTIVKKNTALLQNSNSEPFLENACCNTSKNALMYFYLQDKSIMTNNNIVIHCYSIIDSINTLNRAPILYDPTNNKLSLPNIKNTYNEEIIYKAFVHFCNFDNNLPIDDEIRSLCLDKPLDYNINNTITENIEFLKGQGKMYSLSSLTELLNIINKQNILTLNFNYPMLNNLELLRVILDKYEETHVSNKLDQTFFEKMNIFLDTFDIKNDNNENLRMIKNYLGKVNVLMKQNIIEFIKKIPNLSKVDFINFQKNLDIDFNANYSKFFQNYIYNFIHVFPNIVLNKNINYYAIPNHWNLSDVHRNDIANIVKKYYNSLNTFSEIPELELVFKIIKNKCAILIKLMNIILYNKPISIANSKSKINSIFDENFIKLFYTYVFYTIINEYINITNDEVFKLEITSYDEYDNVLFNEKILNFVMEVTNIMNNHYALLNNNYRKVKENIAHAKEKEKDLITDYLKNLTDEEREIENIFKNNKLEKWSKGLQKGLTQYVKENYDEERVELEKQAIKEKKLKQNSNVTEMNKQIYELDLEDQEAVNDEIEKEEYDMDNIPDDDDDDSDLEFD